MEFDYINFLERYGIEYKTRSPNAGRGEIAIRCPFCGAADPSEHMSINLDGRGWMCRRARDDSQHRGKSPARLIRALIGCSAAEAARIVGAPLLPGAQSVADQVEALLGGSAAAPPAPRELREPAEFKKFIGLPSERPFMRYLEGRGFPARFVRHASAEMGLRYCTAGPFAGRVIFLVHMEGQLATWTGRAISPRAGRRYQAHTPDPELAASWGLPPAALPVEQGLLWYDDLLPGGPLLGSVERPAADTIYLCEGPFDSLKVNMLGWRHGIVSTCFFTSSFSSGQENLLHTLLPRFKNKYLLLDQGTLPTAVGAASKLVALGVKVKFLPPGLKDPGELSSEAELLAL